MRRETAVAATHESATPPDDAAAGAWNDAFCKARSSSRPVYQGQPRRDLPVVLSRTPAVFMSNFACKWNAAPWSRASHLWRSNLGAHTKSPIPPEITNPCSACSNNKTDIYVRSPDTVEGLPRSFLRSEMEKQGRWTQKSGRGCGGPGIEACVASTANSQPLKKSAPPTKALLTLATQIGLKPLLVSSPTRGNLRIAPLV